MSRLMSDVPVVPYVVNSDILGSTLRSVSLRSPLAIGRGRFAFPRRSTAVICFLRNLGKHVFCRAALAQGGSDISEGQTVLRMERHLTTQGGYALVAIDAVHATPSNREWFANERTSICPRQVVIQ